jgi:pimeloyl-ACP methyl ester carboxylesterase
VAEWLAMNVRRAEDGLRLRLDLEVLGTLLEDYFAADLWPVLEDARRAGHLRVVLGGRSASVPPEVRARLESLAARASQPNLSVRVLPDAGHWLQIDDPEGLLAAVAEVL